MILLPARRRAAWNSAHESVAPSQKPATHSGQTQLRTNTVKGDARKRDKAACRQAFSRTIACVNCLQFHADPRGFSFRNQPPHLKSASGRLIRIHLIRVKIPCLRLTRKGDLAGEVWPARLSSGFTVSGSEAGRGYAGLSSGSAARDGAAREWRGRATQVRPSASSPAHACWCRI